MLVGGIHTFGSSFVIVVIMFDSVSSRGSSVVQVNAPRCTADMTHVHLKALCILHRILSTAIEQVASEASHMLVDRHKLQRHQHRHLLSGVRRSLSSRGIVWLCRIRPAVASRYMGRTHVSYPRVLVDEVRLLQIQRSS